MALLTMFLVVSAVASLLASPTLSANGGLWSTLKHVDHGKSLTRNELFQRALQRTKVRVEARQSKASHPAHGHVKATGMGEFSMSLSIGTPGIPYHAIIDIDTDLIWIVCNCNANNSCTNPTRYDPAKSTTYTKLSCSSQQCKLATNTSCNAEKDSCTYKYDILSSSDTPSYSKGDLAVEKFGMFNGDASVGKFIFGCANDTSDDLGGVDYGFVGLGRGYTSLTSQLKATKLSHCFPSYDDENATGVIAFGAQVKIIPTNTKQVVVTTDLIQNPLKPSSYYVSLKGIKVNGTALDLNPTAFQIDAEGQGGTAMETGMTVSYLDVDIYTKLKEKLHSVIKLDSASGNEVGLDLCFAVPQGLDEAAYNMLFPSISFTFGNGNKVGDLVFALGNVFRSYDDGKNGTISCLAMLPAQESDVRSSFGNMQLQQTLVVYDLVAKKASFVPNLNCSKI